nr:invasin [Gordonia sp. LAM0048]
MSGDFVVNSGAMDGVAGALEGMGYFTESAPRPDISATISSAIPNSPLVGAGADATAKLTQAQTAVSGQWETFASAVRAARTIAVDVDDENAAKFRTLSALPGSEAPR